LYFDVKLMTLQKTYFSRINANNWCTEMGT